VGQVMAKHPDAHLIVMSDHGFAAFDRAMHLNTWLLREGFLTLDDPSSTGPDELFRHVDWSRTQAYALGLNGLYLNLRGRERNGTVEPGAPAELLLRVITRRLLAYRDPASGGAVISAVDAAGGAMAPDLIVGYGPGYRSSWESALGAIPAETMADNRDAWIGDHCIAARHVPGALLSNRPVREDSPQLTGLAPAILREFGLAPPQQMKGRPVF
jgi:predicted AlkP superfamily phosphohydrolase/phosphomutase